MTVLLSYRENDLFNSLIPKLGIKATETVIFPRGTENEPIKNKMQHMTDYDVIITDYTVLSCMPKNEAQSIRLDEILEDAFSLDVSEDRYIESLKKILGILNHNNKPVALVKDSLCDHAPSKEWFSTKFTCYRKSQEDSTELVHFVPEEGYKKWMSSEAYSEIEKDYDAGLLNFKSGWKQKPGRLNFFSSFLCNSASVDLVVDFLQNSCSLNARVVENASDVYESEFMIVDRHVKNISRTENVMMLPIEDATSQMNKDSLVKISDVEKIARERLIPYIN